MTKKPAVTKKKVPAKKKPAAKKKPVVAKSPPKKPTPKKKAPAKKKAPIRKKPPVRRKERTKPKDNSIKLKGKEGESGFFQGNEWWKTRSTHGKEKIFKSSKILWEAACEYFQWVEENPLKEAKAFAFQGKVTTAQLPKMRAMTIQGLCIFLDIGTSTWGDYKSREGYEDYSVVMAKIEEIIYSQKFSGAAADLLNANIIARDLGLVDKKDNSIGNREGEALLTAEVQITSDMDIKEASRIYQSIIKK